MTEKNKDSKNENLEASEQTIDPRLDNRVGDQRPPLETFPAKPQQIDGPDLAHQPNAKEAAEMAKDTEDEDDVTRKGDSSPGPHGLGETHAPNPYQEKDEDGSGVKSYDTGKKEDNK